MVRKTFSDSNQLILTDPVSNTTVVSELKNTLGQLNCISKDNSICTLDNVFMVEGEDGNFGANFDLPAASTAAEAGEIEQTELTPKKFTGVREEVIVDEPIVDEEEAA